MFRHWLVVIEYPTYKQILIIIYIIQTINNLSNQFENDESQQFNQLKSKFEEDSALIKKLITYDEIQIEIKTIKENEAQLRQQIEALENQLRESEKRNQDNVQVINDLKKDNAEQMLLIQDLRNQNEELSHKFKLVEEQKASFQVQLKDNQTKFEIIQQSNYKNEQIVKQLQLSMQFSQSLTFSTIHKHTNCSVIQNGKAIETNQSGWQCCMCDQMIPKNGLILFAFKIIEINSMMIGIGFRDIVQSNNYQCCYSIRGGTYNIHYSGYCYNHDQQYKNDKQIAFRFSQNDIIIVEVDIEKKYVKWTKQTTNESFTLAIDTSKDLYPCVHLASRSKVEILNQVFK